ncbi:protein kinase superfamily protein [Striga asiatica]|uniref:mitogen-activated protein kinase kinase kinase n=1 Tax=Striga asiatica TaxID=4170 RepID=A0A5A7RJT8_STRAF|nr:protein kinase superfamily protein [Striga asiatica]
MRSWWGKSSKNIKKKSNVESIIFSLHRSCIRPRVLKRQHNDSFSEKEEAQSRANPLSQLSSKHVSCSHSSGQSHEAQPLPLPGTYFAFRKEPSLDGGPRNNPSPCHLKSGHVTTKTRAVVGEGDMASPSNSSETSSDTDDPCDSRLISPHESDYENGMRSYTTSPCGLKHSREMAKPANSLLNYQTSPISPKQRHVNCKDRPQAHQGVTKNAPDTPVSSPPRSPTRIFGHELATEYGFWPGKQHADIALQGSGQCSSPGSGYNSGNNSITEDMPCQLLWPHCRCSPECSPLPSPRMMSPGPGSRIHSGGVSPLHPRAGGTTSEPSAAWSDNSRQQSHPLPLPPVQSGTPPFVPSCSPSPVTSPRIPRSPVRTDNPLSPTSCWKKGRALGRGTFGQVYLGFNSESGEMCAMKEVTLFSDDAKSKESAQQLGQVDDKLYIYLEYVSGGSIHKILQDYGQLGEAAIRSYTQQILSGLAYLHAKNTVHRDIKGANILVDPNGRVKVADFGMAKHITGQSCPLSFKGSPYWMAPEVITNSSSCNLAVDIWSLGCTVLEMATAKPPWSQYEGVAAMFKVGNSKELPNIPDHLSDEGKDFVMKCLQRNPSHRPTSAQLLEHPFVKNCSSLEGPVLGAEHLESIPALTHAVKTLDSGRSRRISHYLDFSDAINHSKSRKDFRGFSDGYTVKNYSGPLTSSGNTLSYSPPPQHIKGRVYPYPSGASTPPGGSPKFIAIPPYHPNTPDHSQKPKIQKAHSSIEQLTQN